MTGDCTDAEGLLGEVLEDPPLRRVPRERSLKMRFPELAAELHPDLNGALGPSSLAAGTSLKVWWRCAACGHVWQARVSVRVRGSGCPVCTRKRVAVGRSLAESRPELARELHPDRNLDADANSLAVGSNRLLWWRCAHGHEWQARVFVRTAGAGCPVCARVRVPAERSLGHKYPELAAELHPDRNVGQDPATLAARSNRMVWWRCTAGHEWEARLTDRVAGTGCPHCYREGRAGRRHLC